MEFTCQTCGACFKTNKSLQRHVRAQHLNEKHQCTYCHKPFMYVSAKTRHEKNHCATNKNRNLAGTPNQSQVRGAKRKLETPTAIKCTKSKQRRTEVCCKQCGESFPNRHEHYLHRKWQHYQTGSGVPFQQPPWGNGLTPFENNNQLTDVYEANRPLILANHQESGIEKVYNYPISNAFRVVDIMTHANEVYDRQQSAFRVNLEFGLILVNTDSGEYRYFTPYSNESLFECPIYVSRRQDLHRLRLRLERLNITDFILRQRTNTKWKPVLVTNVRFIVYSLNYPLGTVNLKLPDHVKNSKFIIALDKTLEGKFYKDHLCAFRCLGVHQGHQRDRLETHVKILFNKWVQYMQHKCPENNISLDPKTFKGVELSQLVYFENCFQINVNVFRLQEDQSALPVYKSRCHFKDTMHLNLFDKHLSYISNLNAYTQKYQCPSCQMHFKYVQSMKRHSLKCQGRTKHRFPGGFYSSPKTIFDKLEEYGIVVPAEERIFPWFLVFDFEAMLTPAQESKSDKLTWTAEHVPISVSICSNVEGFKTPHCIIEPNTNELVAQMVQYMSQISDKSYELAKAKFSKAFAKLDRVIQSELPLTKDPDDDESFLEELVTDSNEWQKQEEMHIKQRKKLRDELDSYCRQIPCISFNGSKYDLNLIKKYLAVHLKMHDSKTIFTVKRNSQYACLSNENFKFLDITQYLSITPHLSKHLMSKNQKFFSPTNGLCPQIN